MKTAILTLATFTLFFSYTFSQAIGDYQSAASGTWATAATWQTWNGAAWVTPGAGPTAANGVITILTGHTVTIGAAVSVDQVTINTGATVRWTTGVLTIANGAGTDLIVNGTFIDESTSNATFGGGAARWQLGANGTYIKRRAGSAAVWRDNYEGGMSTIPATSNWIIQKTLATNPVLTTVGGTYYGNLTIENQTGGTWTTAAGSTFQGNSDYPRIKGNFDIGGTAGLGSVVFLNQHTNVASGTLVQGNMIVRAGNTFQNFGTGINLEGNLINNGTITYDTDDPRFIFFTGGNAQTITNTGTLGIYNMWMLKTTNTLTLNSPITIDNLIDFTSGIINSSSINLLTINSAATVANANNTSFVNGPVRRLGATGITFPIGKVASYRPLILGNGPALSPVNIFTEDFNTGGTGWTLNQVMGAEGADANFFTISGNEGGTQSTFPPATTGIIPNMGAPTSCGTVNANATLHITSVFNPSGGAAYDAGGLCGFLFCPQSNRQTTSPVINTTGFAGLELVFDYIENGQTTLDNGSVFYSTNSGGTWVLLDDTPKTTTGCGGQGIWVTRTLALPATCDNITTLRIAFRWVNNDDGAGTDPSMAIDNVIVRQGVPASIFTAEYFPTNPQVPYGNILAPTLTALSDCEYWILDRNAGTDARIVGLTWNAATCYNTEHPSFEVARYDGISTWQDHDGISVGVPAAGTVTTPAPIANFSPLAIAYIPTPLPVEMLDIAIKCEDGKGMLTWQTASEINNDYFVIERSLDAVNWGEIGRENGNGNSNSIISYLWVDIDPIGDSYYRIKQVDFNGEFKIYDPLYLSCKSKNNLVAVYPNPSNGTLNIKLSNNNRLDALMIYSNLGELILSPLFTTTQGSNLIPIDISYLPPGTYYLRLLINEEWITKPVVIIK